MGHNREKFGALLKSIIGNFKSIIGSGLMTAFLLLCIFMVFINRRKAKGAVAGSIG